MREPTQHTSTLHETLCAQFAALGLQRARIRARTARVAALAPATAGWTQLTLDTRTEDRRALEPVIDKANGRYGIDSLRPAALTKPRPHLRA